MADELAAGMLPHLTIKGRGKQICVFVTKENANVNSGIRLEGFYRVRDWERKDQDLGAAAPPLPWPETQHLPM